VNRSHAAAIALVIGVVAACRPNAGTAMADVAVDDGSECAVVAGDAQLPGDFVTSLAVQSSPTARGAVRVNRAMRAQLLRLQDAGVAFGSSAIVAPAAIFGKQDAIARIIHGVEQLQQQTGAPNGAGIEIAVVDVGAIWADHPQFLVGGQSRVSRQTKGRDDEHATHVAGSITSAGFRSDPTQSPPVPKQYGALTAGEASKGVAPAARVRSYAATDCDYEGAVSTSKISNFSIVKGAGWERVGSAARLTWLGPPAVMEDPHFGRYDVIPQFIDRLVFDHPSHLVVAASGNDQGPSHSPIEGVSHWDTNGLSHPGTGGQRHSHEPDNRNGGVKSVHSWCIGKNVLCVGSIEDRVAGAPIIASSYANAGPTDDGRVKPDLAANGTSIMSLTQGPEPPLYAFGTGTSSAAPTVSGIAALVLQEMNTRKIAAPAALVKAVLIHSAEDDDVPGPDLKLGWGIVRADLAIELLSKATLIQTLTVRQQTPIDVCFAGDASARPRVTMVWTDPPGPLITASGDEPTRVLVNDLDLELLPPGRHNSFHPWVIEGKTGTAGPNHVDNVEVVSVLESGLQTGTWRLSVRPHRFDPKYSTQEVALIVTGLSKTVSC
jgi:subtilisin family serine protease